MAEPASQLAAQKEGARGAHETATASCHLVERLAPYVSSSVSSDASILVAIEPRRRPNICSGAAPRLRRRVSTQMPGSSAAGGASNDGSVAGAPVASPIVGFAGGDEPPSDESPCRPGSPEIDGG